MWRCSNARIYLTMQDKPLTFCHPYLIHISIVSTFLKYITSITILECNTTLQFHFRLCFNVILSTKETKLDKYYVNLSILLKYNVRKVKYSWINETFKWYGSCFVIWLFCFLPCNFPSLSYLEIFYSFLTCRYQCTIPQQSACLWPGLLV